MKLTEEKKVEILKEIIQDRYEGNKVSFQDYAKKYLPQEDIVKASTLVANTFRTFKISRVREGLWVPGVEIEEEYKEKILLTIDGLDNVLHIGGKLVNTNDLSKVWYNGKEWCGSLKSKDEALDLSSIDFEALFSSVKPILKEKPLINGLYTGDFDRLVFTDTHVGMEVNKTGNSLFGGVWNRDELFKRLGDMIETCVVNKKSNTLIIMDLGDFLDSWNGKTTRGSDHTLPSNMSTQEMFEVGLKFKTILLESLSQYYDKIKFITISNDNHSGTFSSILNHSLKVYCEKALPEVEVINQYKFLDHYYIKNYCFILTHGKDEHDMKHGLPVKLAAQHISKIKSYIDHFKIDTSKYNVILERGDVHQYVVDSSEAMFTNVINPAFSPASTWGQINFDKGKSGYLFYNHDGENTTKHEKFFKWNPGGEVKEIKSLI